MNQEIFIVDAFTSKLFSGNPAAVCPLKKWISEDLMKKIAMENNLSETAFFVKENGKYHIRWFTPTIEVPLCGHATLASSFVIFNYLEKESDEIIFTSLSGELSVSRNEDLISLNFPANKPERVEVNKEVNRALNADPKELYFNKSFLAVFETEEEVKSINPDFREFERVHSDGIIVTAPGNKSDFVSRYFVPSAGIDEDPVTGFAHTLLTPFWSEKLNKTDLHAFQISQRGGELYLKNLSGGRVEISGKAVIYSRGTAFLDL